MVCEISPIRKWIICISGFRQNEGHASGISLLAQKLHYNHSSPECDVLYRGWDSDWSHLASRIKRESYPDAVMRVFGYSYGGGWGAIRLAEELAERYMLVDYMILSDPVYRSPWTLGRWRSIIPPRFPAGYYLSKWRRAWSWLTRGMWLFGRTIPAVVPKIRIPDNVNRVIVFQQSNDVPMGHDVYCYGGKRYTAIDAPNVALHESMDDLTMFHRECERVASL